MHNTLLKLLCIATCSSQKSARIRFNRDILKFIVTKIVLKN